MKSKFLEQVAQVFVGKDLSRYSFVFPNRRSSLFFRKYLGELSGRPIKAPVILTVDELFERLSTLTVIDELSLLFRLWNSYTKVQRKLQRVKGENLYNEPLDEFFYWGKILLSDFNDIDQYLVDPKQLFTNVKDLEHLSTGFEWMDERQMEAAKRLSAMRSDISDKQHIKRRYFDIWDSLYDVYSDFKESLLAEDKAYTALRMRVVAEDLEACKDKLEELNTVVFVGFSAPTVCEKNVMKYLQKSSKALFYWDYYSEFIKAPDNKSSMLISKCVEEFPGEVLPDKERFETGCCGCNYQVIPAAGQVEQTMIASKLLQEIREREEYSPLETAIVVSDENLLLPLLSVIDEKNLNITMGYPVRSTAVASLFNSLAALHLRAKNRGTGILLSGSVLREILSHPYIQSVDEADAKRASDHILESNMILVEAAQLTGENPLGTKGERMKELLQLLVPPTANATLNYLRRILEYVSKFLTSRERCFVNGLHEVLDAISASAIGSVGAEAADGGEAGEGGGEPVGAFGQARTVYSVIRSGLNGRNVAFRGEPLQGVQIMGPLETRCLDFKNIIFLSFNDGVFPASGERTSAIPYFLRKAFNLPTYEDKDSISSYNFYRLIQRAENVYMIYDTNTENLKTKEESRFIKQLVYDFGVKPVKRTFNAPVPTPNVSYTQDIILTDKEKQRMLNFFVADEKGYQRHLSPSSLNTYINCNRRFFFDKILGLGGDEDDLTDSVEAKNYGDIFHYCMEHIYSKYLTSKEESIRVTEEFARRLIAENTDERLDELISDAFRENMRVKTIEGENLVIKESVKKYIKITLKKDLEKVQKGEYYFEGAEYPIDMGLFSAIVSIKIDRLENHNGLYRVCDYKSGKFLDKAPEESYSVMDEKLFLKDLENMFKVGEQRDTRTTILFQLFFYALMISEERHYTSDVELCIYQLQLLNKCGPIVIRVNRAQIEAFAQRLKLLLEELEGKCSPSVEGRMPVCSNYKSCTYCDFVTICNREVKDE